MTMTITGDRRLDRLLPSVELLVRAAHTDQAWQVDAALADAETLYGDPLTAAHALVVLLAAMVPDDCPATGLLRWRINPHEYRRLRTLGVPALEAAEVASRVRPLSRRQAKPTGRDPVAAHHQRGAAG